MSSSANAPSLKNVSGAIDVSISPAARTKQLNYVWTAAPGMNITLPKPPRSSEWGIIDGHLSLKCQCSWICSTEIPAESLDLMRQHFRVSHQMHVSCRLPGLSKTIVVKRSPAGFSCPRCAAQYRDPWEMRDHAAECGSRASVTSSSATVVPQMETTVHCKPDRAVIAAQDTQPEVMSATRGASTTAGGASQTETFVRSEPDTMTPTSQVAFAPPPVVLTLPIAREPSTAGRQLSMRTNLLKSTTRAQRAMIRHLHYSGGHSYSEIADHLNVGPTIVKLTIEDPSVDSNEADSDDRYIADLTNIGDREDVPMAESELPDLKEYMNLGEDEKVVQDDHEWGEDDDDEDEDKLEDENEDEDEEDLDIVERLLLDDDDQDGGHIEPSPYILDPAQQDVREREIPPSQQCMPPTISNILPSSSTASMQSSIHTTSLPPSSEIWNFLTDRGMDLALFYAPLVAFGCATDLDLDVLCTMSPDDDWLFLQAWMDLHLTETEPQYNASQWSRLEQLLLSRRIDARPYEITTLTNSTVYDFLNTLRKPLGHHLMLFFKTAIRSPKDLNDLCQVGSGEALETIWHTFAEAGLSAFDWLVVREGLKARTAALGL